MSILDALETFDDYLWYIPFVLIILLGLYALIRLKGAQFTQFKEACKVTFSKEKNKNANVSSFHVFCVSMGNRIGVGNIAGPVTAILVGGPGAIFWMWVFALLGSGTSLLETTIGQIYKDRNADGECHGGPAYNIAKGLNLKKAGLAVAFVMVLMYILGFVSMEVSSISESLCNAFVFDNNAMIFAIALTILTAVIIVGGFKRIADISTFVVPLMAVAWIIICIVSICISGGIGNAFVMIFQCAFNVPAAVGGGIGAMLLIGMKRGILSNEAGVGTITNISSIADVNHPVQQGLSQSLGVLIDTLVSTLTALVVLSAFNSYDQIHALDLESMPLLQHVFEGTLGGVAPALVAIFVFVFAITCLMSDYVIGDNNLKFITDKKIAWIIMCIVLLAMVFLSSFYASDEMFAIVDILLAICGIINCIVMFKIGGRAVEAYRDYRRQKAEGIETPEFHKSALNDQTGVTEWKD